MINKNHEQSFATLIVRMIGSMGRRTLASLLFAGILGIILGVVSLGIAAFAHQSPDSTSQSTSTDTSTVAYFADDGRLVVDGPKTPLVTSGILVTLASVGLLIVRAYVRKTMQSFDGTLPDEPARDAYKITRIQANDVES